MEYNLLHTKFEEYELIDSGEGEKLERFGKYLLIRPEPKAIWNRQSTVKQWFQAHARYVRNTAGGGKWKFFKPVEDAWHITWDTLTFELRPMGFKHVGIFPEQASIWEKTQSMIRNAGRQVNVLNLFAYTGGSTVACLSAGAKVTHVDSVKDIVDWAHQNVILSGLDDRPVRWIVEDAVKYVRREIKRGHQYDAVIMDPPKFGRGSNGEVWKLEKDLPLLIDLCKELLTPHPLFFLVNAYDVSFTAVTLRNIVSQRLAHMGGAIDFGELIIQPTRSHMVLSTSIFSMWHM